MSEDEDPWLTTAQAAELAGMSASSWRTLVIRGSAPAADDPGDLNSHPRRRTPRWRRSTVVRYRMRARHRGLRTPGLVQDEGSGGGEGL